MKRPLWVVLGLSIGFALTGPVQSAFAVGACCFQFGFCTELDQAACTQAGGTFMGEGTTCDPNPCPADSSGACCKHDGTCEVTGFLQCFIQNGWWEAGHTCQPDPCSSLADGACCIGNECTMTSLTGCHGWWWGPNIQCADSLCVAESAACCFEDETCQILDEGTCLAQHGFPVTGIGSCEPNPCPGQHYACCLQGGVCQIIYPTNCYAQGGLPSEATSCTPNPCSELFGACCLRSGACQVMRIDECYANGGWFLGQQASCDPDPCSGLTGACCVGSECTVTGIAACAGIWLGPESTCDPNPCQTVTYGACCVPNVGCELMTPAACQQVSGDYLGDNTNCEGNPCPSPVQESTWGKIKARYHR